MPSIRLISPRADAISYFGAEVFKARLGQPVTFIADLILPTLAAMAPDDFQVVLTDEQQGDVDLDCDEDFIGLTGKTSQQFRMLELAREFRSRGKTVLIGGPNATLAPQLFREHCDILVCGEIELLAKQLFNDLRSGRWLTEYVAGRPPLGTSPIPRWDLYNNDQTLYGCVQTARGCPFTCEFCDVIQYVGRNTRFKSSEQVLAELEVLYEKGYSGVFLADDNFTAHRKRAKELLVAIRDWNNSRTAGHMTFGTQVSIDIAKDRELLQLCAEAGLDYVYIGIESPNEDSLRETMKRQNVGVDLNEQIDIILDHGIAVMGGMICGFDADGPDIFERQYTFAMQSNVPIWSLGALVAPHATPLYSRLEAANRLLIEEDQSMSAAHPWVTNIQPAQMTKDELTSGIRKLVHKLYHPTAFGQRLLNFIERIQLPVLPEPRRPRPPRAAHGLIGKIIENAFHDAMAADSATYSQVLQACEENPIVAVNVHFMMAQYAQIRYMLEVDSADFTESERFIMEEKGAAPFPIPDLATSATKMR